jgi:outer membrane protein TolC
MDMVTLAAILGHSKLNMVTRYAHPQEKDKADAMNRLEKANAAAEIAEFERLPTISPTIEKPGPEGQTVN